MTIEELDPSEICRDERCSRAGIHRKHLIKTVHEPRAHHRPDPNARPLWKRPDPNGLINSIARATSKAYPMWFSAIAREVRDDYGNVDERTIYRYLKVLVDRGHILKLDLGLQLAAYIRPGSRLLKDLDSLREYMLAEVPEMCRSSTSKVRYARRGGGGL